MNNVIGNYTNGNYKVTIYEDGTKIRYNDADVLIPEFVESMDIKISNFCPYNCNICHEKSNVTGKMAELLNDDEINTFIDSLHEYTELAIGGGAVTYHKQLIPFLEKLKEKKIIPSITVNQREFYDNGSLISKLIEQKLIYGLGVSYYKKDEELFNEILKLPNVVIHLIAGYHSNDVFKYFANKKAKILILGYKQFGRGKDFYSEFSNVVDTNIKELSKILPELIDKCEVVSFDNLALKQLDVKRLISDEEWNEFFMGNDGEYTMYVDLVNKECAKSSTSETRFDLSKVNAVWNGYRKIDVVGELEKVTNDMLPCPIIGIKVTQETYDHLKQVCVSETNFNNVYSGWKVVIDNNLKVPFEFIFKGVK